MSINPKSSMSTPPSYEMPSGPLWRRFLRMPFTRAGRWSTWLMVGFAAFLSFFYLMIAQGQRGGETFFSNLWLTLPMLAAAISAIAGGLAAAYAIFIEGERSFLVFLSLLLGLFVLVLSIGEISGHD